MHNIVRRIIPLVIFLTIVIFLWWGLARDPRIIPSPLINQAAPEFTLPELTTENERFTTSDLGHQISLVNVWASWCAPCREEHPVLMGIRRTTSIPIYGINYKDDWEDANDWLQRYGNPFTKVGFDAEGSVSLEWGVYGAPEIFLVDQKGIIRYKHIGVLTQQNWEETLLPLIDSLKNKSSL